MTLCVPSCHAELDSASHSESFSDIHRGQIPKRVRDDMACVYNLLVMLNLFQHLTASHFLTIFRGQIPKRVRDDMVCVYNLLVMLNLFQHLTASLFLTIFRGQEGLFNVNR